MFSAPSIVPVVGCKALIAPVSYIQWLQGAAEGLSIPQQTRGVKGHGVKGKGELDSSSGRAPQGCRVPFAATGRDAKVYS